MTMFIDEKTAINQAVEHLLTLNVNRPNPAPQSRLGKSNIPPSYWERRHIRRQAAAFMEENKIVPPTPMEELTALADRFTTWANIDAAYRDFAAVCLNNEAWKEMLAAIPYERRLLLLPRCLRIKEKCPAYFDEFGLLCQKCGLCAIQELQEEAERLGYAVLVSEGSTMVTNIIQTGKIEAIVGISCLNVLARALPYMEAAAIPGLAIPLLRNDCADSSLDMEWAWEAIHLTSEDKTRRLDLDSLRRQVGAWFTIESLTAILGRPQSQTEKIALEWLARDGKRWRPFLAVCAWQALQDRPVNDAPDLIKIAVSLECFHKASLIHDDIEDQDAMRYGEKSLHEEYGVAVALNVGDFLLGEGYRLIAELQADPEQKNEILRTITLGHRTLTLGQGAELYWMRHPRVLSLSQVIDIFRQKTAPAFQVALAAGVIHAGAQDDFGDILDSYSKALGIAYQIKDDLEDFESKADASDLKAMRPSLLLAVAYNMAQGEERELLQTAWQRSVHDNKSMAEIEKIVSSPDVREKARQLLQAYKEEALRSISELSNANLKGLLRRVVGKIVDDIKIKGWCREFETRNAASRPVGKEAAGRF